MLVDTSASTQKASPTHRPSITQHNTFSIPLAQRITCDSVHCKVCALPRHVHASRCLQCVVGARKHTQGSQKFLQVSHRTGCETQHDLQQAHARRTPCGVVLITSLLQ